MQSPTAGQPVITAEHLSKWYGQVSGLNDVSVKVPTGISLKRTRFPSWFPEPSTARTM